MQDQTTRFCKWHVPRSESHMGLHSWPDVGFTVDPSTSEVGDLVF